MAIQYENKFNIFKKNIEIREGIFNDFWLRLKKDGDLSWDEKISFCINGYNVQTYSFSKSTKEVFKVHAANMLPTKYYGPWSGFPD